MSFPFFTRSGQTKLERIRDHILEGDYDLELSDRLEIIDLISHTVGIRTRAVADNKIAVGMSKIGGNPDLPEDFVWPDYNGEPLTFCAQYNLRELSEYDLEKDLPKKGLLYVFIYIDQDWPGFMNRPGSFKVIYVEDLQRIKRVEFPENYFSEGIFRTAKIEYFEYFTLPDPSNYKLKEILDKHDDLVYICGEITEFIDDLTDQDPDNFHQVLGEDRSVQASVGIDFAARLLQIRTTEDFWSKQSEIVELSKKYRILLQIDCNDRKTDLSRFGGSMVIYFGIEPEALRKSNFENVVMAFQNT